MREPCSDDDDDGDDDSLSYTSVVVLLLFCPLLLLLREFQEPLHWTARQESTLSNGPLRKSMRYGWGRCQRQM